jgi:hypothetical protein
VSSPKSSRRLPLAALAAALLPISGCSRDDGAVSTAHAEARRSAAAARTPAAVVLPGLAKSPTPYVVEPVTNGGTIAGTVAIDGPAPLDSTIHPPDEIARTCGGDFVDRTLDAQGPNVRGAIVWLEGIRRGRALPVTRRYEVSIDHCRLVPRVQPVVAGSTIQLHSLDALRSLVRVTRWPGGETRSTIATNNDGEVVPDDRAIGSVGTFEVRGAQPAWLRAWVLAFDHPYFTTSGTGGTYALTEIPPGQYRLVAWHERLGRVEQPVTVTAGQTATVAIRMRGAPNAAVADPGVADSGGRDTTPRADSVPRSPR